MMRFLHVLIVTLWLVLLPGGMARAQGAFGAGGPPNITARLIAETATPAPGQKLTLAFVMRPARGWHGYWINPGDAGKGVDTQWTLPRGMSAGPLRYPVPHTLLISGLMNHVYEGEYALLADVRLPADARVGARVPVRVRADWLACTDRVCVPEGAELTLDLTLGDGRVSPQSRAQFDGYRARMPRPLGAPAYFEQAGDILRIAIPMPASARVDEPYFFRLTDGARSYAAPQSVTRDGDRLVVTTSAPGERLTRLDGVLRIGPDAGLAIAAVPGSVPAARGDDGWSAIAIALLGAFVGGVLLNIMPCVFPVLSLKAIGLARAGADGARREALAYGAGVVSTCLLLGAALLALRAGGVQVGWAFQLQSPPVILGLCLLSFAITLNLAGVFAVQGTGAGDTLTRKGGHQGAFWTGALVAFVATPCTGPFMAAALGAALVLPVGAALAIFAGLGLGLAAPFVGIAFVPALRRALPKPGAWMVWFARAMAVPMALTTLALLWLLWRQAGAGGLVIGCVLLALAGGMLALFGRSEGRRLVGLLVLAVLIGGWAGGALLLNRAEAPRNEHGTDTPYSAQALERARASGRPVFVYFTADWCVTCKVNEAAAINTDAVRDAWAKAGVVVMVGDWTNGDPAIGRFLEERGRSGIPLYLWYPARNGPPRELPQVLTPAMLSSLAKGGA